MKFLFQSLPRPCIVGLLTAALSTALSQAADDPQAVAVAVKDQEKLNQEPKVEEPANTTKPTSRIFLINGDKLRGQAQHINDQGRLVFDADSLRQTTEFPIENILSLNLEGWETRDRPATLARIQLQPRFHETTSDTLLGALHELTPDSIKLQTWYGGMITLKRSMVKSLNIINNSPGSFFGPHNIKEWNLSGGKGSWQFINGALASRASGGIGRDVGLQENSHISFNLKWTKSMNFRLLLYSSDTKEDKPDAYYDLSFNRNYIYLRTHGKSDKAAQRIRGGARWKKISILPEGEMAHFDIFADRKSGTFTVYINGQRASLLQSLTPDPKNLGTGLSFIAEQRYPIEVSNLTIIPWNGTSLPNQARTFEPELAEDEKEGSDTDEKIAKKQPPHKILLNNGDEVPGTVGKVQDGRMIIETEFTPIRIPIKLIKSLSLGDTGEEIKKYTGDIRAWFHQGGYVTLKLTSLNNGRITGSSQALGDVSFDISAFNRIDFRIYNKTANALRKKIR